MKKLSVLIFCVTALVTLMSSSGGCNLVTGGNAPLTDPYDCINTVTSGYIDSSKFLGVVRDRIIDTTQFQQVFLSAVDGDKYWVVPTANILAMSTSNMAFGTSDKVVTFHVKHIRSFTIDPIQCCGWYDIPSQNTANQTASIFFDCKSTHRFTTYFRIH